MTRTTTILVGVVMFAIALEAIPSASADDNQSVRTESGKVRCFANANDQGHGGGPLVVCQTSAPANTGFQQAPLTTTPGFHMDLAVVRATGAFNWDDGNIPGNATALARDVVMNYGQTYRMNGWTVLPSSDGTSFTNDGTGHGMFVSVDNVNSF
jgi:hypothetical protein